MLDNPNIDKKSRIQLTIIENHLLELYHAAVEHQRGEMFMKIRKMIQEKEAQGDQEAVAILDWVLDRLL